MTMRKFSLGLAILAVATMTASAYAGVIIVEKQTSENMGRRATEERTVFVQGDKQKIVAGDQTIVTDLDQGVVRISDTSAKTYVEMPFPPEEHMPKGISQVHFKKTGVHRKVAGYSCDEYTGHGRIMNSEYTVTACFSKSAPGAGEYSHFEKKMTKALKGSEIAITQSMPDGVPLALTSKTKLAAFSVPGMSSERAKALMKQFANRPPVVSTTEVTSIQVKSLPGDTFATPAGYAKREMPVPGMPAMPPPSGHTHHVPE